jgi:hypothetical protein
MRNNGSSEHHQNNNLKVVIAFGKFTITESIMDISYNLAKINKFINFSRIRKILGIMDGASRTTWRCKSILTVFSYDAVAVEHLR